MNYLKPYLMIPLLLCVGCSIFDRFSGQKFYDDSSGVSQSSNYTRTFNSDYEHVWGSVIMSLGEMSLDKIDEERGLVRTDWIEGVSEKPSRIVLKQRYRLTFTVSGNLLVSSVHVRCQVEEYAKVGSTTYRWVWVRSTGEREEEALMRLEEILAEDKG